MKNTCTNVKCSIDFSKLILKNMLLFNYIFVVKVRFVNNVN